MDIDRALSPEHLVDISRTLEESKDTRFWIWKIEKYCKVADFLNQLRVANSELITSKDIITYETLTQEACSEYFNLLYSNLLYPASNTKGSDETHFPKAYADQMVKIIIPTTGEF